MAVTLYYRSNAPLSTDSTVKFAASFLEWNQVDAQRESEHVYYALFAPEDLQGRKQGAKVHYKFVVNGEWKLSDDSSVPTEPDLSGIINHVYELTEDDVRPSRASSQATAEDSGADITLVTSTGAESAHHQQHQQNQQRLKQRNTRRNSAASTASTVMVLYNKSSPYNKFFGWCYSITIGRFVRALKYVLGISRRSSN